MPITTQTVRATKVLDSSNITDGKVEITVNWPTDFADKNYVAVASSSWIPGVGGGGAADGIQEAGERDRATTYILVVANLLSIASVGDTVNVDVIAIGNV